MKSSFGPAVLWFALLATAAHSAGPRETIELLMLGDSITLSGSAPRGGKMSDFARLELDRLSGGRVAWSVTNQGVGRETARRALRRIRGLLDSVNPDVVTIAYGLVDGRERNPARFEESIVALVQTISECEPTARIVLIAPVPIDESIHEYGRERAFIRYGGANRYIHNEINARLRDIAMRYSLPYIDLFRYLAPQQEWRAAIRGDGVHPDAAGNRLIGEYLARTLAAYYEARVWNIPAAREKESEARRLLREAAGLFFKRGSKALERCAELEDRAWKMCPYAPEMTTVFAAAASMSRKSPAE